ncbi:MAG TPA: AMP-binding protein, partial [Ilumatobacteraceae bacterium]|nr:AMP-binding protein [Ilumatobacteraceae bacterium]
MADSETTGDSAPSPNTVADLLPGDATGPALLTVDNVVMDHAALRGEVDRLAGQLRAAGLRANDRIAIVLPNGPEMALVLLAAMSVGCAAPLNPKYREDEFRFYLDDLHAAALITIDGASPAAHSAAPVGTVSIDARGEGLSIDLITASQASTSSTDRPAADDQALVLHTSGTTSRPKIVPLRQR